MKITVIGATTHVDRHGTKMTKEVLESMVMQINSPKEALPLGVEHDLTIPPIGKSLTAMLVQLDDGEHGIEIVHEVFEKRGTFSFETENFVITKSEEDNRPFKVIDNDTDQACIGVDPMNLGGYKTFNSALNGIFGQKEHVEIVTHIRKAAIPDPEVIIYIGKFIAAGWFAKSIGKAVTKDVTEKISKDIASLYDSTKAFVKGFAKRCVPRGKEIPYIFILTGPFVAEFIILSPTPEQIVNFLNEEQVVKCLTKAHNLNKTFPLTKIQFLFQGVEWKINYMTCNDGSVIGTKEAFSRQNARVKTMLRPM